jgi:DNA polymerase
MYSELEDLEKMCRQCTACELHRTRANVVFSDGVPNGRIMLIGEAPGYWEDQEGKPFVGKSGKLLDKILSSVDFDRKKNIYICNIVKCRPPDNRNPSSEEQLACKKYLDCQIDILKPRIILLCGAVALKSLVNTTLAIAKVRGQWFAGPHDSKMMPLFHPSYLLRSSSREEGKPKWLTWRDFKEIRRLYDELR